MKNAILVHGCCKKDEFLSDEYPSGSNSHWFPWLQKQLIKEGIETQTPEMPTPYAPEYKEWKRALDQFSLNPETILVGHSCGAGFLLRWLGDHEAKIKKLILVAPWLDPVKKRRGFLDFEINPAIQERVGEIHALFSVDDPVEGVKESVDMITENLPQTHIHAFDTMGHFTSKEMESPEFPALLELIR